jgi:hypothetical protein
MAWSPKQSETLRDLWESGHSAGVIGQRLGLTRDAVLGRARRMGLQLGEKRTTVFLPSHKGKTDRRAPVFVRLPQMSSVWTADEDKRRRVFATKAASGARKALEAIGL